MNHHVLCLKGLLQRETWAQYGPMLGEFDSLEREHKQILQTIESYYQEFPTEESITVDELQVFFQQLNPAVKDGEIYGILFDQIKGAEVRNPALLDNALRIVADHHYSTKAMARLVSFLNEGKTAGMESIVPLIEEYHGIVGRVAEENPDESTKPLRQIMEEIQRDGLAWPLGFLNDSIGPVYPGTLGHVLARPETGKTAFCVASAAYFAYQLRETPDVVLYLSNEENVDRTRARTYASLIGTPVDALLQDTEDTYEELYARKGGRNLRFVGQVNTIAKVEANLIRYRPKVVVVDQGPKVMVPGGHSQVEARQIVYNAFRNLADRYHVIFITAGQADSAAENKKWVTYNHIDGSKVGIPGECDYIIGIGSDENDANQDYRYFCLSKNKLGGKQGRFTARIDTTKSRYIAV